MKPKKPILRLPYQMLMVILVICCSVIFLLFMYTQEKRTVIQAVDDNSVIKLLIDTPGCKIPSWNPWDPSVKPFYSFKSQYKCDGLPSFLLVRPNAVVSFDDTILQLYYELGKENVSCTYQAIHRSGRIDDFTIDTSFELGPVKKLVFDVPLNEEFIKTICIVLKDGHEFTEYLPLTPLKPSVESRCQKAQDSSRGRKKIPNVIFLGIDSISRLNFFRHFPKTNKYISEYLSPFSLKGYNKVGDNTFPNIVPLLTGHHYQYFWNETSNKTMYFDDVELLWKKFSKLGYRTLLAEDAPEIATFNYYRSGFKNPPTDYYFRPFALATEHSSERYAQCLGNKMEMVVVYEYLKSFLHTMNNTRPLFAFVFLARLTHDVFNFAGYADEPTFRLLQYLKESDFLNNTILVFFSDHGIRFSSVRNTYIGQFEERRPFVHLMFPHWFTKKYPKITRNLKINQERLTTPFDIHTTILDLLNIDKREFLDEAVLTSPGISLFNEVSSHRTCDHASISPHWCTCQTQKLISVNDKIVMKAAVTIIETINSWTQRLRQKCSILVLQKIHSAHIAERSSDSANSTIPNHLAFRQYLVVLSALPSNALFEATVRCKHANDECSVTDDISRINKYGSQSACINDVVLRKYCYCV